MTKANKENNQKEIMAIHRFARISASKVRLTAKMVKRVSPAEAINELTFIRNKASQMILKVLKSAIANAGHDFGISLNDLSIKNIEVGEGPTLKRWRARSRGMSSRIFKRTAHIKVVLVKREDSLKPENQKTKNSNSQLEKKEEKKETKSLKENIQTKE